MKNLFFQQLNLLSNEFKKMIKWSFKKILLIVLMSISGGDLFCQIKETEPNDAMTDSGIITITNNGDFSGLRDGLFDTQDLWFIEDGTGGYLQIDWAYETTNVNYFMEVREHTTSDRSGFGVSAGLNYSTQTGTWAFDLDANKFYTIEFSAITTIPSSYSFTLSGSAFTDQSLSANEFELDNFVKLYPNPSNDYIQISGLTRNHKYTLYNVLGTKIKNGNISNNELIDIRHFTNGLYFLKFEDGNTKIKFIKE